MEHINYILITIIIFSILFILQLKFENRKFLKTKKINSYKTNLLDFIFNNLILKGLGLITLYLIAEKYSSSGIFSNLELNIYSIFFLIVLLDFLIYLWHLLNHKINFLWMFHKAHHSDDALSTLSALRFHIGELFLSIFVKSLIIIIFGIPVVVILFSEFLITIFAMFHHSNFKFKAEKYLSYLIIVPHLHFTHHSTKRQEHDTNYGVIFSFWDRIFKTYLWSTPKKIGLENIKTQNFLEFLKFGFKYKY